MAEMIRVICKTTTGSQTLSHIAKSERLRASDGAAINHITAAASRACWTCLNVLADERIRKAC